MKAKFIIAAIALFFVSTISVSAQTIKKDAVRQHHRIKQGVRSGELTRAEAKNLKQDQKEIHQDIKEAKSDGVITPDERKDIRKDQRKESREIYRKKHNQRIRH